VGLAMRHDGEQLHPNALILKSTNKEIPNEYRKIWLEPNQHTPYQYVEMGKVAEKAVCMSVF